MKEETKEQIYTFVKVGLILLVILFIFNKQEKYYKEELNKVYSELNECQANKLMCDLTLTTYKESLDDCSVKLMDITEP